MAGIHILSDIDSISRRVADKWITLSTLAIQSKGAFHVALSGGSTPKRLYERLAEPEYSQQIDWSKIYVYFGDERSVAPEHEDSNYKMAKTALFDKVNIPAGNIHRMHAESKDIDSSASEYESLLKNNLPVSTAGVVMFDLVLLGMGDDGHTASLFPDTKILSEKERFVSPVYVNKLSTWRMSLTFPVINSARHIFILIAGENKKAVMAEVLAENPADEGEKPVYPIQMLDPVGDVDWYLDEQAAMELPR